MTQIVKSSQDSVSVPVLKENEPDIPRSIQQIRTNYRKSELPKYYCGRLHFCFTTLFSLAGIGYCVLSLRQVTGLEWLTVPLTFLYANFVEYVGHRWPMHRPYRLVRLVFDGHTHIHHRFYTEEVFAFEKTDDFHALLLPPYLIVFFLGLFALPVGFLLYWLISLNVAYLFVATALAYFLNYELLHFCYHAPDNSWVLRLPFLRRLRKHHQTHHNPKLMTRYNFNITYPVFDWVFGTVYRAKPAGTSRPETATVKAPGH
jgi:hypothetical protein